MWEVGQHAAGWRRRLEDGERNLVTARSGRRLEEGDRNLVRVQSGRVQAGHSCLLAAPPAAPLRPGEVCSSSSFGVGQF